MFRFAFELPFHCLVSLFLLYFLSSLSISLPLSLSFSSVIDVFFLYSISFPLLSLSLTLSLTNILSPTLTLLHINSFILSFFFIFAHFHLSPSLFIIIFIHFPNYLLSHYLFQTIDSAHRTRMSNNSRCSPYVCCQWPPYDIGRLVFLSKFEMPGPIFCIHQIYRGKKKFFFNRNLSFLMKIEINFFLPRCI